jgi:hypothetical protein
MLHETVAHLHHLVEGSQADVSIENDAMEIIGFKVLVNQYSLPVLSPTAIVLQNKNFLLCQLSVISHKSKIFSSIIVSL